jgi:hypothetical protein
MDEKKTFVLQFPQSTNATSSFGKVLFSMGLSQITVG